MLRASAQLRLVVFFAVFLVWCLPATAELFVLRDGGRVVGRLLNPDQSPRVDYEIETLSGGQITLSADQIVDRKAQSPREAEYERQRAQSPDTIDGHWAMAEWCREHYLSTQRKIHLRRILQLDPDHKAARGALGYRKVNGEWKTHRQVMEERGFRWFRGRWLTQQQIEILKRKDAQAKERQKWFGLLKQYNAWLAGDRFEQGRQAILAIDDPVAVPALDRALADEKSSREVKSIYIETLTKINSPAAVKSLATCAVEDNDEIIREMCLDRLGKEQHPDAVAYFISQLRSKDNVIINRAAVALSAMRDKSAVGPLIKALVTKHKYRNPQSSGSIGAQFGSGGGGLSVGAQPKYIRVTKNNQEVLDALTSLTGVNLGFDVKAWNYWFAHQKKRPTIDTRRDR